MRDTLDDKCEEYQVIADNEKAELRDWKVIEWFRQSNTRVVKSMRDHLLLKKENAQKREDQSRHSCGSSS